MAQGCNTLTVTHHNKIGAYARISTWTPHVCRRTDNRCCCIDLDGWHLWMNSEPKFIRFHARSLALSLSFWRWRVLSQWDYPAFGSFWRCTTQGKTCTTLCGDTRKYWFVRWMGMAGARRKYGMTDAVRGKHRRSIVCVCVWGGWRVCVKTRAIWWQESARPHAKCTWDRTYELAFFSHGCDAVEWRMLRKGRHSSSTMHIVGCHEECVLSGYERVMDT